MSALPIRDVLTADEARSLTDDVKADAAMMWAKLLSLYEGDAHTALGYSSWADYCAIEFDMGKSRSYQVLDAARVVATLPQSTIVERPRTESVARELVPLRNEPVALADTWNRATTLHGPTPTAAQVREVVAEVLPPERTRGQLSNQKGGTDEWATPQDFFDVVNAEFGFTLDVCALDSSAKAERYFTPETDGLAQEWTGTVWMNPPYGDVIAAWMSKAYESARRGATVVCLVPARTDTAWFHDYCFPMEVRFIKGRLRFGEAEASAPFPSCLVVLGPNVAKRAFDWSWR